MLGQPPDFLIDSHQGEYAHGLAAAHPEIEVISRDQAGEYAAAARKGAPQAQQIADKFHILKNLREGLKELMARKQKVLPEVEEDSSDSIPQRAHRKRPERVLADAPKPDEL